MIIRGCRSRIEVRRSRPAAGVPYGSDHGPGISLRSRRSMERIGRPGRSQAEVHADPRDDAQYGIGVGPPTGRGIPFNACGGTWPVDHDRIGSSAADYRFRPLAYDVPALVEAYVSNDITVFMSYNNLNTDTTVRTAPGTPLSRSYRSNWLRRPGRHIPLAAGRVDPVRHQVDKARGEVDRLTARSPLGGVTAGCRQAAAMEANDPLTRRRVTEPVAATTATVVTRAGGPSERSESTLEAPGRAASQPVRDSMT